MSLPAKDSSLPGSGDHKQGNKLPVSIQECEREDREPGDCSSPQPEHTSAHGSTLLCDTGRHQGRYQTSGCFSVHWSCHGEKQKGVEDQGEIGKRRERHWWLNFCLLQICSLQTGMGKQKCVGSKHLIHLSAGHPLFKKCIFQAQEN